VTFIVFSVSSTRHSSIGQLSPSKLATPTLDKYEAKVSPSHHPISEDVTGDLETKESEGRYGTDAVTSSLPEETDHGDYKRRSKLFRIFNCFCLLTDCKVFYDLNNIYLYLLFVNALKEKQVPIQDHSPREIIFLSNE
jgi:hypothetical protein